MESLSPNQINPKFMKRDSMGFGLGKRYDEEFTTDDEATEDESEAIPMEVDLTAHGPPPPRADSLPRQGPETLKDRITRYAKMILPHIGLVVLLGVYTICGAGVFHALELPNEKEVREREMSRIYDLRGKFIGDLWNMSSNASLDMDEWYRVSNDYLDQLAVIMFEAYQNQFITAEEIQNKTRRQVWTLPASIFFATTVITTIGYGNMAPTTFYGRVFCIVFGLFGIPLLLVTIADIGKFLSDLLSFLYRTYSRFKRKLKQQSRKISSRMSRSASRSSSRSSPEKSLSPGLPQVEESEAISDDDELRIPVVMVMLVLVAYTALGGLLFRMWEGWPYFEAFYFCFITMATIGFGDLVPTEQVYMFFTMAYIVVGLALATMCIDLAGTEYIRKIHYVGHKIESAKEMVGAGLVSGLHVGEHLLKHTGYGFIRTAGGKIIHGSVLAKRRGTGQLGDTYVERNILYTPVSPAVLKHVKAHIKVHPEEIRDKDAYILHNKVFNQPPQRRYYQFSPETIQKRFYRAGTLSRRFGSEPVLLIAPFVLKESDV